MTPEQLMQSYLAECDLHVKVLSEALVEVRKLLPISPSTVQGQTKEQLQILDQLAYRFAKLQDTMGRKIFPTILNLAQEPIPPCATFTEKLN